MPCHRTLPALPPLRAALLCMALLLPAHPARGQARPFAITGWSTEQGLPSNVARDIAQTADGFLWLASYEGLVRFDGVSFRAYTEADIPGLGRSSFRRVAVDGAGVLWAASETGGLVRYADGRWSVLTTREGLKSDRVTALLVDRDGSLWVGTRGGINRIAGGRVSALAAPPGGDDPAVTALARDGAGSLWIGTVADGLLRYRDGAYTRVTRRQGLGDDRVTALASDRSGAVLAGTFAGLTRIRDGRVSPAGAGDVEVTGPVNDLLQDGDGSWCLAADNGLFRVERGRVTPVAQPDGRAFTQVEGLHQDLEGSLWIGSRQGGLYRLRPASVRMLTAAEGLPHDFVSAVTGDGAGGEWIATRGGLVHRTAGGARVFTEESGGLGENVVRDVLRTRAGAVWAATNSGLTRLRGEEPALTLTTRQGLPDDRIRALLEDDAGALWIGTYNGLARFRDGRVTRFGVAEGLTDGYVLSLFQDRRGTIWVGTQSAGLFRLAGGRFHPGPPELRGQPTFRISDDPDGTLWVGTTRGLARVRGGRVTTFTTRQGIPGNTVFQALDDGRGSLWLTGPWGIARVPRAQLEAVGAGRAATVHAKEFGLSDGLAAREASSIGRSWRAPDGTLAFPTPAGLALIDPRRLPRNRVAPRTRVERVVADDLAFEGVSPVTLPPGVRRMEFHFTAPSFVAPGQVQFRYRLEGFDPGWVDGGTRRAAYYTNVPPGSYRFRVQARNEDGVWSANPALVRLSLRPYFWQTRWFLALGGAALLALVFGVHRLRVRAAQMATREQVLRAMSLRDDLTGLYNRRGLVALAEQQMEAAADRGVGFDLLFIDMDRMKEINDTLGHAQGDRALQDAAGVLRSTFRRSDVVARLGGDEFAVLLIARASVADPGPQAQAATARLQLAVERHNHAVRRPYRLSMSVGASRFDPAAPITLDALLESADRQMYAHKRVRSVLRA